MAQSESFDVAVIGGGTAGIAAAVSAARRGARTLLVERSEKLGGNASQAFVHTICGLYRSADEGDAVIAHPGFPQRFARALRAAGGAGPAEKAGRVWILPTYPPVIPSVAAKLCEEMPGLEVRTRRSLVAAELGSAADPHRLVLEGKSGREPVEAAIAVDTSGDAWLAALGGAETAQAAADELQIRSFIFRMAGVDAGNFEGFGRLRITRAVAGAARTGELPEGCESLLVRRGAAADEVYLTLNVPRPRDGYDPLDPDRLDALQASAREHAEEVAAFLKRTRAEFAQSRILAWPERIGVRETRRLCGLETVEREDVVRGRTRHDEVAVSTWPIELWPDHRRARFEHPDGACSVPLGALVSRSHPRIAMAGRCLSASHDALGALRVIGTALATGEAAGIAAALAADRGVGPAEIAAGEIRDEILRGAEAGEST